MGKKIKFELADKKDPAYRLLAEIVEAHHSDIGSARIALVYEHGIKEDCDGHLRLGHAKHFSPFERLFHPHDFAIVLNSVAWAKFPEKAKRALLDHELSHCGSKTSEKTGEVTYYMRKHDMEEFTGIVRRHGLWESGLEAFVKAALKREESPMFPAEPKPPEGVTEDEIARVKLAAYKSALKVGT